jgi:hypothetical protein
MVPSIPPVPRRNGKGHRLCHAATSPLRQPGAKAPGQRPPRPRRALLARRVGRWPVLRAVRRSLPHRRARAGETQCVSLFPPGEGAEGGPMRPPGPPPQWQRPPPLPRRNVASRQPGAKAPGQRPPRPWAGHFAPPGRALACVARGETVLATPSRRGRGNAVRFLSPPEWATLVPDPGKLLPPGTGSDLIQPRVSVDSPVPDTWKAATRRCNQQRGDRTCSLVCNIGPNQGVKHRTFGNATSPGAADRPVNGP